MEISRDATNPKVAQEFQKDVFFCITNS